MTVFGFKDRRIPDLLTRNVGRLTEILRTGGNTPTLFREPKNPWLFNNASGETAPARAVMQVTGVTTIAGRDGFTIDKPDGSEGLFVFNGYHSVANGDNGVCYVGPTVLAATDASAANGTWLGVTDWELSADGDRVLTAISYGPIDADSALVRIIQEQGGLFEIVLTKTGGSQGTTTAANTYVYTVADIDGNELGTSVSPVASPHKWVRHFGLMTEADSGIATWDLSTDALKILYVNEQHISEVCS